MPHCIPRSVFVLACFAIAGVTTITAGPALAQCDPASLFGPDQQSFIDGIPTSVAIGDLNGDGVPDLVVAKSITNFDFESMVSVLLGNGDGTYQPRQDFPTGGFPFSVAIGDLDADGIPDLVVANFNSNSISVLLGNGDGTFQPRMDTAVGSFPAGVVIGDFNGDGRLDIAVAEQGSATASVLLGNGDGTFQPRETLDTDIQPFSVVIGDFDGDGNPDLAVANRFPNSVSVFLGFGNGTFRDRLDFPTGVGPYSLAIGDFNGDGITDIATANEGDDTVSVLTGNGDGTFQPQQQFITGSGPVSVAVGDFDGDGNSDIAVANRVSNTVSVLVGNGDGTFQTQQQFTTGSGPISLAIGDLNDDGNLDYAVANNSDGTVGVRLNQCALLPQIVQQPKSVLTGPGPTSVIFTVAATSDLPLSYQWLRDGVPMNDSSEISGTLSPTLSIVASATDVAAYRCVVSNSLGQTTSSEAVLGFRLNPMCLGDTNGDGVVDLADLSAVLNAFGTVCP